MAAQAQTSKKGKRRLAVLIPVGLVSLFGLFMLSLSLGSVKIPLGEVWGALTGMLDGIDPGYEKTIYYFRMPRALGTFAVGIGLSVAGVVFQAIIRNPLVDPYMTGVSSGAGFGASVLLVSGISVTVVSFMLPIAAFAFAIIAFLITFAMATVAGGRAISYVLGGVMTAMAFGALTTIILMLNEENAHSILSFLFGSFTRVTWDNVWIMLIPTAVISFIFLCMSRSLNVALLGEEQSMQLGLDHRKFKLISLSMASMLTAFAVAFVGIIGFVGLVVPHLCRMVLGGDHRLLIPASMVVGAALMCVADIIARSALSPQELPVGAVMTLIGIPFFAFLLMKRGKNYSS